MSASVYIETTIISYLAARQSRVLLTAAHQAVTRLWWDSARRRFDLYTSELVYREAGAGDVGLANRRVQLLAGIPSLRLTDAVTKLAHVFVKSGRIPESEPEDALHISVATVHNMDYLLTWNCKHIANAEITSHLRAAAKKCGYELPIICTPEELMGGD